MKYLILLGLTAFSLSFTSCHSERTEQLKRIADKIDTPTVPVKKVVEERVDTERRIEGGIMLGNHHAFVYKLKVDSIEYLVAVNGGDGGIAVIRHSN